MIKDYWERAKAAGSQVVLFYKRQTLWAKIGIVGGLFVSASAFAVATLVFMIWVGVFGHIPNRKELSLH